MNWYVNGEGVDPATNDNYEESVETKDDSEVYTLRVLPTSPLWGNIRVHSELEILQEYDLTHSEFFFWYLFCNK